jgi:hypothetical protein
VFGNQPSEMPIGCATVPDAFARRSVVGGRVDSATMAAFDAFGRPFQEVAIGGCGTEARFGMLF